MDVPGTLISAIYMGGPVTTAVLLLATGAVGFGGVAARAVRRRRRERGDAAEDPERGLDADAD